MPRYLVGAYTADMGGRATGIVALESAADGSLRHAGLLATVDSPAYLAAHGDRVYAASEAAGTLEEFRHAADGALLHLGAVPAGGVAPCHVARYGDSVVTACYVDGALGVAHAEPLAHVQSLPADGSGPHPAQDGAHAHATCALPDGTIVSADLGADRIRLHTQRDGLLERTGEVELPAGTGPRDFLLHPSGHLYVLGELGLAVLVFAVRGGTLTPLGSTALHGARDGDHAAALSVSDDGRFLWAGLRGSNRISVLAVSADGASLDAIDSVDAEGDWPRHHVVDGDLMHVAHEKSHSVASFRIDEKGIPRHFSTLNRVFSPIFLLRAVARTHSTP
jgi:6-phosphogluconolactonase